MITEVTNMYSTGITMLILGAIFGIILGISGWDWPIMRGIAIVFGVIFVIGIVITGYYYPLEHKEYQNQQHLEQIKESELKNMSCISIQNYLLQSLPDDNDTTKFAHSVFDLKCKGVSTT